MGLDLSAIGRPLGPFIREYGWKDIVLYALSVGAGFDELEYVWEKNLKIIPTFSVASTFYEFLVAVWNQSKSNPKGVLHGEEEIIFYNSIPNSGKLITDARITDYFDKGDKGAVIRAESNTIHSNGAKLFTCIMNIFSRYDGGFGGKKNISRNIAIHADRADFIVNDKTSPNQTLLYRLTGDLMQGHIDPELAREWGFERPIMHGLCTMGFGCRALVNTLIKGNPENTKRIACRFTQPLYPGEPITTNIWVTGCGKAAWQVVHGNTGQIIIDNGEFEYTPLL